MHARTLAVILALAFALPASAQTNAPAPAGNAPASSAAAPKPECGQKPGDYPGNVASDTTKRAWQKDFVAYVDCLKKFIEEQQAVIEPHTKAMNAAIAEYNGMVKAYNDQVQKKD